MKVLVSEALSDAGMEIFQETPGISADVRPGLTSEELRGVIGEYQGLAIRSETRVTADIIEAAHNLKVIGRAGIALENVDIPAASRRGIVVMNTPEANTVTTAEHAVAMMLALSRNIPRATIALKEGRWEREGLQGREVYNKILGLIGAGHIGRVVADRAKGLKMKVLAYDPYIKPETLEGLDMEPVGLEELLERADYVTVHAPLTEETAGLLDEEALGRMKKGAMLIHCAVGGIVDEAALYRTLTSGHLAGAALDVFETEPPGDHPLMGLPNVICTPHLGASTREAQDNMAVGVAGQIVDYLLHGTVKNAVNVPSVSAELMGILRPYVVLAEKLGSLQGQLAESGILEVQITYSGKVAQYDAAPLSTAVLKGLLAAITGDEVNFINALPMASDRGIKVVESKTSTSEDFASLIKVGVRTLEGDDVVSGTIFGRTRPRILRINDFYMEAVPEGHILFIHSQDVPGVIGRIATALGAHGVNIDRMHVGQDKSRQRNVILLATSVSAQDHVLEDVLGLDQVYSARRIEL